MNSKLVNSKMEGSYLLMFVLALVLVNSGLADPEVGGDLKTGNKGKVLDVASAAGSGDGKKAVIPGGDGSKEGAKSNDGLISNGGVNGVDDSKKKMNDPGFKEKTKTEIDDKQLGSKGTGTDQRKMDENGAYNKSDLEAKGKDKGSKKTGNEGSSGESPEVKKTNEKVSDEKIINDKGAENSGLNKEKASGVSNLDSKDGNLVQERKEGLQACESSSNSCSIEEKYVVACLRFPGNESPDLSLLVQNKGKGPVNVTISAPDFVKLERKQIKVKENDNEKVKVSIGNGKSDGQIVIKAGNGKCVINFPGIIAVSDHECSQKRCSPGGPMIRFPFVLREKQPPHCGYDSRFSLYCDEINHTIIQLSSGKVKVTALDYVAQTIEVQSLEDCFAKQSRDIDLSETPFVFEKNRKSNRYSVFNCSASNGVARKVYPLFKLSCLDDHAGYEVYAIPTDTPISYQVYYMGSCTKLYTTYKWDSVETLGSKFMKLSWSLENCRKCEVRGGTCGWNNRSRHEIGCFGGNEVHSGKWMIIRTSGSIVGCFFMTVLIAGAFHVYSKSKQDRENKKRLKKFLEDYTAMRPTRYSYADIKKITNDFKDGLGKGGQGNVFKGKVSNEVFVAVKILGNYTGNGEDFINEVGTMGATHHVNVVRLLGFCADGARRALVYEFVPNGSLDKFLFDDNKEHHPLGMVSLKGIAVGIARGVEYLHQGCEQRILHFDIKPHNILLDKDYNPKICDFGLAKLCEKGRSVVSMTGARGTMGYIAPEVFSRHFGSVTHKSDIYSFGMLLLEMVGRRKNIDANAKNDSQVNFSEWVYGCLVNGEELRIEVEDDDELQIAKKLAIVGLWCIQWNPVDRPSITSVIQMLEDSVKDLRLPPNPFSSDISDKPDVVRLPEIIETE